MSISAERNTSIQTIYEYEREQLFRAAVDHFVIPIVGGLSMDEVSQADYNKMGGPGLKPNPLSAAAKLTIYTRMDAFYRPKLLQKITDVLLPLLNTVLSPLSDAALKVKAQELKPKTKTELNPDWTKLPALFKDHACLFKDLKTTLTIDPMTVHDALCPLMAHYRDSGELFTQIRLNELIKM